MTDKLPPNLLALFAPRPPLRWVPPSDHAPGDRKTATISGVGEFMSQLQDYKENDVYDATESWLQRKDRIKAEKRETQRELVEETSSLYKPQEDANIRGDAFKTLIVARLSFDATEKHLESEFGRFGAIERIRIVKDTHADEKPNKKKKKHRGYAFVVFEREKDMRAALDNCDGIRIEGRRIKVDVERGRTVRGWKPRRFGGGLGGRGYTKTLPPRSMGSGAYGPPGGPAGGPGGFRGGQFRGGFEGGRSRGFKGGYQDRGGFGAGRGGVGYQGGGGFRGSDRNGHGGSNGYAPPNAPAGPGRSGFGSGGRPGHGSETNGSPSGGHGGYDSRGGGRPYDDRSGGYRGGDRGYSSRDPRGASGSNMEPVRPRNDGGGYRDRDSGSYDSRKRGYEGEGGYEDPRKLRRY